MLTKKIHRFTDCRFLSKADKNNDQLSLHTEDLTKVTCVLCKHRIVSVISNKDWNNANASKLHVLNELAKLVVSHHN